MSRSKAYIIAEAGVNHNGSLELAKQLVDVAAAAGADAIKFQTFKAENLVNVHAPQAEYQTANIGKIESQFEMLKRLELKHEMHFEIASYCKEKDIVFLSTPFDKESLDFLINNFDMPFIKIGSGEVTNAPFLLEIARTGKDVILSTGMSTLKEVKEALSVLSFGYYSCVNDVPSIEAFKTAFETNEAQKQLKEKVKILHCSTEYPCPLSDVNLNAMLTMEGELGLDVGYSDHTAGIDVSLAAVTIGAKIIEKHFTLDKTMEGPDHKASLEPDELKELVREVKRIADLDAKKKREYLKSINDIDLILGDGIKAPSSSELKNISIARKSIIAKKNIASGEIFSKDNICVKRPGSGLSPLHYWSILGEKSSKYYNADEVIA